MTFLTIEAHCMDEDFENSIAADYGVTVKDRANEPWCVVFEGEREQLQAMYLEHWANNDILDALESNSEWLSETYVASVVGEGHFLGPVIAIEQGRIHQSIGRGASVWHDAARLDGTVPEVGINMEVRYSAGRGAVHPTVLAKSPGVGRG